MSLVVLILVIALLGILVGFVFQIDMPPAFKQLILGLVILGILLFIFQAIGVVKLPWLHL